MKKHILLYTLLFVTSINFAQNLSTGVIQLDANRSVRFDINTTTSRVTMTMVMPQNTWLGIGLGNDGIALNEGMGSINDDAIIGISTGIEDRNMQASTGTPPLDVSSDWQLVSNNLNGTVRTIIGTRALNTGDIEDFTFPSTAVSFPLIYAKGGTTFTYHGQGNNGLAMATLTTALSTSKYETSNFTIYPNPASTTLNINFSIPNQNGSYVEVYNVLGKRIFQKSLSGLSSKISISDWNSGVYLVKVSSENNTKSVSKRFVKL